MLKREAMNKTEFAKFEEERCRKARLAANPRSYTRPLIWRDLVLAASIFSMVGMLVVAFHRYVQGKPSVSSDCGVTLFETADGLTISYDTCQGTSSFVPDPSAELVCRSVHGLLRDGVPFEYRCDGSIRFKDLLTDEEIEFHSEHYRLSPKEALEFFPLYASDEFDPKRTRERCYLEHGWAIPSVAKGGAVWFAACEGTDDHCGNADPVDMTILEVR